MSYALRLVTILWLCFIARGSFHALAIPVWEGIDEYAHVAVVDRWTDEFRLPRPDDPISPEILASLCSHPLPVEMFVQSPSFWTYADWWAGRPAPVCQPNLPLYEAQQPPLYYWLMAGPWALGRGMPVENRVLMLRLLSVLIASTGIIFTFLAAERLLKSPLWAAVAAAVVVVFPNLLTDVARVGNDSLAFALFSALLWLLTLRPVPRITGVVFAAGLLTKVFFLVAIPVTIAVLVISRADLRRITVILMTAFGLSGWWYLVTHARTGSWTGWSETAMQTWSATTLIATAMKVHWVHAAGVAFRSFIWFGDWSFLKLPNWMYIPAGFLFLAGALVIRSARDYWVPITLTGAFALAMTYHTIVTYLLHDISASPGWYFCTLLAPIVILLVAGLRSWLGTASALAPASLLIALDAYGNFCVSLPFYAGLARQRPDVLAFTRMAHPWSVALWFLGTTAAAVLQWRLWRRIRETTRLDPGTMRVPHEQY